jgi:CBS domain-containing protein
MADRSIGALPVVESGRVVGILTQSDVVTAVARQDAS